MDNRESRVRMLCTRSTQPGSACPRRAQHGLTLVELVVALAIIGLISASAAIAISQVLLISAKANDRQLAISQVRAAEHWMSRDALSAQEVQIGDNQTSLFTLTWNDVNGTEHTITYALLDMTSSDKKRLERQYFVAGSPNGTTFVAAHVVVDGTPSSAADMTMQGVLEVRIVASVGSVTTVREFEVKPRPSAEVEL